MRGIEVWFSNLEQQSVKQMLIVLSVLGTFTVAMPRDTAAKYDGIVTTAVHLFQQAILVAGAISGPDCASLVESLVKLTPNATRAATGDIVIARIKSCADAPSWIGEFTNPGSAAHTSWRVTVHCAMLGLHFHVERIIHAPAIPEHLAGIANHILQFNQMVSQYVKTSAEPKWETFDQEYGTNRSVAALSSAPVQSARSASPEIDDVAKFLFQRQLTVCKSHGKMQASAATEDVATEDVASGTANGNNVEAPRVAAGTTRSGKRRQKAEDLDMQRAIEESLRDMQPPITAEPQMEDEAMEDVGKFYQSIFDNDL